MLEAPEVLEVAREFADGGASWTWTHAFGLEIISPWCTKYEEQQRDLKKGFVLNSLRGGEERAVAGSYSRKSA